VNWALKTASHSASVDPQRRQLRSSASTSDVVLRTTTHFGRRTFSVCGRDVWNSLPVNTRLRLTCFFSDVLHRPIFLHCFYFQFNIWTIMYNIFHQRSPPYLKDLVTFSVSGPQRRQLRSSAATSAVVRLSSIDELFLSADKTFGIVCLLI